MLYYETDLTSLIYCSGAVFGDCGYGLTSRSWRETAYKNPNTCLHENAYAHGDRAHRHTGWTYCNTPTTHSHPQPIKPTFQHHFL